MSFIWNVPSVNDPRSGPLIFDLTTIIVLIMLPQNIFPHFILHPTSDFFTMVKRQNPDLHSEHKNNNLKLTDLMPVELHTSTAPTPDEIQWISNKSSYYPFSEATGSDVVEFQVHGTVMDPTFLKGGPDSFSHTVSIDLSDENVELIKSYIYKIPNYDPNIYRWPIQVNAAKFTSKENVGLPFLEVWEISDEKLIRNEDLQSYDLINSTFLSLRSIETVCEKESGPPF